MSAPFDWDHIKSQKFPPDYIGRVKEEHARQTELTAESVMVLAHEIAKEAVDAQATIAALNRMEMVLRLGQGAVSQDRVNDVVRILLSGNAELIRQVSFCRAALATLATEIARMKLKDIKVE